MIHTPESLLAGLDDQQRVAAEALIGPVCMLAGAGTGKTRAITHRIAYGVMTGAYAPNRMMALFTSRAAASCKWAAPARRRGEGRAHLPPPRAAQLLLAAVGGGAAHPRRQGACSARRRTGLKLDTATLRDPPPKSVAQESPG
jgi:DNA helicase-2/ATP-dependent DNA helicase PcrA